MALTGLPVVVKERQPELGRLSQDIDGTISGRRDNALLNIRKMIACDEQRERRWYSISS